MLPLVCLSIALLLPPRGEEPPAPVTEPVLRGDPTVPVDEPAPITGPVVPRDEPPPAVAARWAPVLGGLAERTGAGASFALVLPDGRVWALAAGLASRDDGTLLTADDRFLAGSVGKTFVTAIAHDLVRAGRLDLDATAASHFADEAPPPAWIARVPNAREVTIRQLLRHQSGIGRYEFQEDFFPAVLAAPDRTWSPEERLSYVFDDQPLFAPGAGFAYADTNSILVGMVIEKVAGRPFYQLVRERLLEPHGLSGIVPSDSRRVPGVVQGHVVMSAAFGFPARTLADGVFVFNPQFEWCGGGFASTPGDMARWARLLYSGEALGDASLDTLLDAVAAPELGPGVRYGLGVILRDTALGPLRGHDGFMPGYLTSMGFFPDRGSAAALQLNTDDMRAAGRPLHALLVELVAAAHEELEAAAREGEAARGR